MKHKLFVLAVVLLVLTSCGGKSSLIRVNINNAPEETLKQIPGFTDVMITEIINYRLYNGPFESVEDLVKVPGGFTDEFLQKTGKYLTVEGTGGTTPDPAAPIPGKITFTKIVDGKKQVFVQENLYAEPRQVTFGPEEAHNPKWSPDGKRIVYIGTADLQWPAFYLVDLQSGESRKLVEVQASFPYFEWFGDGLNLIYSTVTENNPIKMYLLDVAQPVAGRELSEMNRISIEPHWFDLSPDGKLLAVGSPPGGIPFFKVLNISGWAEAPEWNTMAASRLAGYPTWSPDGRLLGYMDYSAAISRPCFLGLSGEDFCLELGESISLFRWLDSRHILYPVFYGVTEDYYAVDIYQSDSLKPVAVFKDIMYLDIWYPPVGGAALPQPEENAAAETEPVVTETLPVISETPLPPPQPAESDLPQGRLLYRWMGDSGQFQIWLRDSYGGRGQPLTSGGKFTAEGSWAPDGSGRIIYRTRLNETVQIYLMEQPGAQPKQISYSAQGCLHPSWTQDSQHILAACGNENGMDLVLLSPDGTGDNHLLTNMMVIFDIAKLSPDGKWIAFGTGNLGKAGIYVAPLENPDQAKLLGETAVDHDFEWSPDSSKILYSKYSAHDHTSYLCLAGLDGSENCVYANDRLISSMDWPDGSDWVLFTMEEPNATVEDLYALNLAAPGSEPVLLIEKIYGDIDLER